MHSTLLHLVVLASAAAVLRATGGYGAPVRVTLVRLLPDPGEEGRQGGVMDSPEDDVVLVPVGAPPVDVAYDEESATKEEEDGDPWEMMANLFGLQEATDGPPDPDPLGFFSSFQSLQSSPTGQDEDEDGDGDEGGRMVVLRVGRGLKSVQDPTLLDDVMESRVLEDEVPDDKQYADEDEGGAVADVDPRSADHHRSRRALRLLIRRPREDADGSPSSSGALGRADATPAPPGSFMETVQNQLPSQLQGLGGAMEDSRMIIGSFQAIIMPGSAATDMGQQIQGFIANMPQIPSVPGAG